MIDWKEGRKEGKKKTDTVLYCIVLYLQPVLNPESYDGARVLEASGRPMLVIGRSYWVVPIQEETTKLADETTENSDEGTDPEPETAPLTVETAETETVLSAGTKLMAYRGGKAAGTKAGATGTGL